MATEDQILDFFQYYLQIMKKAAMEKEIWQNVSEDVFYLDKSSKSIVLSHKAPPIICSRQQFQNLLLFQIQKLIRHITHNFTEWMCRVKILPVLLKRTWHGPPPLKMYALWFVTKPVPLEEI